MTIEDRYQISCSYCGHISSSSTKQDALMTARDEQRRHNDNNEHVTVYDLMAHEFRPQQWKPDGFILRWRDRRTA